MSLIDVRRTAISFAVAVLGSALAACGSSDAQDADAAAVGDTVGVAMNGPTVVFQITGLHLVVPPQTGGGDVNVVMPAHPEHRAYLLVGVRADQPAPAVCDTVMRGTCYVDLEEWNLREFGGGGSPETPTSIPGLTDITDLSGGHHRFHKAHLSTADTTARVVLRAGQPVGTCSLAQWWVKRFTPAGQVRDSVRRAGVNVLHWAVTDPDDLWLRFRHDTGGLDSLALPAPDINNRISILLAHVRADEVQYLPPNAPKQPLESPDFRAEHFAALYDLVRSPGEAPFKLPHGDVRRSVPYDPGDLASTPCSVSVTIPTTTDKSLARRDAAGSYACILGTAGGS